MLRKIVIVSFVVLLTAVPAFAKERKGTATFRLSLKAPAEANEVRLWVPYPQTDGNQQITDVSVIGNCTFKAASAGSTSGPAALCAE